MTTQKLTHFKKAILGLFALFTAMFQAVAQPNITSINPRSATPQSIIKINGTGFNSTIENNVLYFGGNKGIITNATDTSLDVTVPRGARLSELSIINKALYAQGTSSIIFYPIYRPIKKTLGMSDFPQKFNFPTGLNPRAAAVGDLDGDGKLDVVIANSSSNTISIYRSLDNIPYGIITFASSVNLPTGSYPSGVAIGDLDNDGILDIGVANQNSNSITIYRNLSTVGNLQFAAAVTVNTSSTPTSIRMGDINKNGFNDITVTNFNSNTVSVFNNRSYPGNIIIEFKVDFPCSAGPTDHVLSDISGDGRLDISVTANFSNNKVSVLKNTSTPNEISFANKFDFVVGTNPYGIASADIDQDGKNDLVVTNNSSNTISILRNASNVTEINFDPKVDFPTGAYPALLSLGSLDGDIFPDIAVSNAFNGANGNTVSVYQNLSAPGRIRLTNKFDIPSGVNPIANVIADFDNDNKPDILNTNAISSSISIFRNADIIPSIKYFTPTNGIPGSSALIVGSGLNTSKELNVVYFGATKGNVVSKTDTSLLVTVPAGASFSNLLLSNIEDGLVTQSNLKFNPTFTPLKPTINNTTFNNRVALGAGANPTGSAMGDIDGDGRPELLVANFNANTISVYKNNSAIDTIILNPRMDYPTKANPQSIALGDLDGDGKLDVVIANKFSNTITIYKNASSAAVGIRLDNKLDLATGSLPVSVAIGDLNNDGKQDILVANIGSNTLSIFPNISLVGKITMGNKIDISTGNASPQFVAIDDLSGDNKLDIAVGLYNTNSVSVFKNISPLGMFVFGPPMNFNVGNNPYSIAIGDLDGDGKLDLITSNNNTANISALRNTSVSNLINFSQNQNFIVGPYPGIVKISDINGDNKPDVTITSAFDGTGGNLISVLQNSSTIGNINFVSRTDFATDRNPISHVSGDLNGDGLPDMVSINALSNSISIFKNSTTSLFKPNTNFINSSSLFEKDNGFKDQFLIAQNNIVEIYPNPTNGLTKIKINPEIGDKANVRLVDMNGIELRGLMAPTAEEISLDLNGLPTGIYFLEIKDAKGEISTHKVVKQ